MQEISKSFPTGLAVDNVSLEISPGQTVIIEGPSGSGKTTLLRLIVGLENPDTGEILIDGKIASRPGYILEPSRRGMGFVFQSPALWPHMTIAQNILFGLDGHPVEFRKQRLQFLLEKASLEDYGNRYPDQVSKGEARRVSILRALAPEPRRLLMDEPLTNIDPELKVRIMQLIQDEVARTGASLILVTHSADEADAFVGRKFTMRKGRLSETPDRGEGDK